MPEAQRLSIQDAFWLEMDKPTNLMVVDSLMWTSRPVDWDRYRAVLRTRLWDRYPAFRSVARRGAHGGWYWVEEAGDDFEAHFEQVVLPEPGDDIALQEFIASQRTTPLDRDKPLWRVFLVDGYRDGSAMVMRAHHALADGIRMVELAMNLGDASPDGGAIAAPPMHQHSAEGRGPKRPIDRETAGRVTSVANELRGLAGGMISLFGSVATDPVGAFSGPFDALGPTLAVGAQRGAGTSAELVRTAVRNPIAAVRAATNLANKTVGSTASWLESSTRRGGRYGRDLAGLFSAAPGDADIARKLLLGTRNDNTCWTGAAGTRKAVSWSAPLPLADVKDVARATGATVNDVLVTCVAGSLRTYLQKHNATCASVNWDVPVNLKPFDAALPTQLGNGFAIVQLELPTNIANPLVTLDVVRHRMSRIKHGHEAPLAFTIQAGLSKLNKTIYRTLVDLLADRAVGVLTNVPGPQDPIYIAGQKVEGAMGWAPLSGDQAMSFTIFSYDAKVFVGIACDVTLVPDHEQIVDGFADEFHRLSVLCL
ncbi:MAG TPA: WS/DGAT domain-containing protein [Jatrophihabitans sp.]|nr:WS/DGAT domain-containing protein [Jatrophihabitans sp.]